MQTNINDGENTWMAAIHGKLSRFSILAWL
jgi:hypothetical protein